MAKAEDDEIILQEVIIDKYDGRKPSLHRSDSLHVPGTSSGGSKLKEHTLNILQRLSPKIAPKFPREKLKSMFRKRKLSSAFPFYKLKGVRFTRDTKDDESVNQSLLDVRYSDPVDVEITLSTPELTEAEKETGIHPYYYTQQAITSAKQLTTDRAFVVRQANLERFKVEQEKNRSDTVGKFMIRSSSLPNISNPEDYARYMQDPAMESSLKKFAEIKKRKEKSKKVKAKKKSPPPKPVQIDDSSGDAPDSDAHFDNESKSRRNTLPEITVTKCEPKAPQHLDLATSSFNNGHSHDRDKDSGTRESPEEKHENQSKHQPPKVSLQSIEGTPIKTAIVESVPETHSTSKKPRMPSPQRAQIEEMAPSKDDARKQQIRKKSPPPKRPEKLSFSKTPPSRKIAGISLKHAAPPPSSPTSDSAPSSPVSTIPSTSSIGGAPSFPILQQKTVQTASESTKRSPTSDVPKITFPVPRTLAADTAITISDSMEDLTYAVDASRPPAPPQRHILRTHSKGKK